MMWCCSAISWPATRATRGPVAGQQPDMGVSEQPTALADQEPGAVPGADPALRRLLMIGLVGGAVALTLGIYANAHAPASDLTITLGFTNTITMKVWLTTVALSFAVVQLVTALWMYGRLPLRVPPPGP